MAELGGAEYPLAIGVGDAVHAESERLVGLAELDHETDLGVVDLTELLAELPAEFLLGLGGRDQRGDLGPPQRLDKAPAHELA